MSRPSIKITIKTWWFTKSNGVTKVHQIDEDCLTKILLIKMKVFVADYFIANQLDERDLQQHAKKSGRTTASTRLETRVMILFSPFKLDSTEQTTCYSNSDLCHTINCTKRERTSHANHIRVINWCLTCGFQATIRVNAQSP